jgi:uncharacterized protein (UPF0261 family)
VAKSILIIGTLDTKGQETLYLRDKIAALGLSPILMDISMRKVQDCGAEITAQAVAAAAGTSRQLIQASTERSKITHLTIAGATRIAGQLFAQGRVDGVVAIGGSTGSLMATDIMRSLPFGVPKIMVSSTAALPGLSTRYIGTGDIALLHSVIEIAGLSDMLRNVIDRAACAMAGMVSQSVTLPGRTGSRPIAMTMLGPCEQCASRVRALLDGEGFQITGFSAAGVCDRAMEEMIGQGFFQGVIDLAPGGVGEHLFGFMRDAGPRRMESAAKAGIPQIISTCSVNHGTPAKSKYASEFHQRRKYELDKYRTWLRLSVEELKQVAGAFAEKLNQARAPVAVIIPLKGWSSVDAPGHPTYDPAEDQVFIDELKRQLKTEIRIMTVDANMEDQVFARAVAEAALQVFATISPPAGLARSRQASAVFP